MIRSNCHIGVEESNMGTDIMNLDRMFSEIKVPSKPHIANEQQPVTHEGIVKKL